MYNYNTHKLYTFCEVCNVFAVHHKYIVEVLGKFIRRTEMNDHSFERKFYGACCYRLCYKLVPGQVLQFSTHILCLTRRMIIVRLTHI